VILIVTCKYNLVAAPFDLSLSTLHTPRRA